MTFVDFSSTTFFLSLFRSLACDRCQLIFCFTSLEHQKLQQGFILPYCANGEQLENLILFYYYTCFNEGDAL